MIIKIKHYNFSLTCCWTCQSYKEQNCGAVALLLDLQIPSLGTCSSCRQLLLWTQQRGGPSHWQQLQQVQAASCLRHLPAEQCQCTTPPAARACHRCHHAALSCSIMQAYTPAFITFIADDWWIRFLQNWTMTQNLVMVQGQHFQVQHY